MSVTQLLLRFAFGPNNCPGSLCRDVGCVGCHQIAVHELRVWPHIMSEGYAQHSFDALRQGGADGADYLSFEKGDTLFRISDEPSGWSWGHCHGQAGWYPTDFWKRDEAPPVREALTGEALGAFDGTGYGEQYLSFSRGQVLQLFYVCRQPNSGWALGAILVDGVFDVSGVDASPVSSPGLSQMPYLLCCLSVETAAHRFHLASTLMECASWRVCSSVSLSVCACLCVCMCACLKYVSEVAPVYARECGSSASVSAHRFGSSRNLVWNPFPPGTPALARCLRGNWLTSHKCVVVFLFSACVSFVLLHDIQLLSTIELCVDSSDDS